MIRDVICCLPATAVAAAPEGAIRAMCGLCRDDVWVSPLGKAQYFSDPEQFIVACMSCVKFLYHTQGQGHIEVMGEDEERKGRVNQWLQGYLNAENN